MTKWELKEGNRREGDGRIQKNESKRVDGQKEAEEDGLRSCLDILKNSLRRLPSLTHDRIDRFYFTAPLFSFNSYPGLIAFCRAGAASPLRCTLMGIHLRSAIDVTARAGHNGCHVWGAEKALLKQDR